MIRPLLVAALLTALTGCSNLISATQDQPIPENNGTRTTGSLIDDEIIETKSLVNLSKGSEPLRQSHISVTSYNGIALITGQVPNERVRQEAQDIVSAVRKVRKVYNELTIAGPTSAIVRTNDAWITGKIKTRLMSQDPLDALRIKIVTENGVVYLMGLVSQSEADIAAAIASETHGTQKVVKIFEYL